MYEFVHSHRTQGWLVLESASVSYGKASSYLPVVELLKRYAHIEDGDESRTVRAKVTGHILTLDIALQEAIDPLLFLLEALPEDSPFLTLDPPQRRQRTLDALKRVMLRESQTQPLLLVFEDLHWIDGETQALLDSLVASLPTARLLLMVNYRPEYHHAWGSKTYYTQLRLDPLPPVTAGAFLLALLGDDSSLEPLSQLLIARTEGNPFFLEESVRTLVETQWAGRRAGSVPSGPGHLVDSGAGHGAGSAGRPHRPPARRGKASRTDGGRDRYRGAPAPVAGRGRPPRGHAASWFGPPPGRRIPLRDAPLSRAGIHLQACSHPAGGLSVLAGSPTATAPRPHSPGARQTLPGDRGDSTRTAGASLHRGGAGGACRRPLVQGGPEGQ